MITRLATMVIFLSLCLRGQDAPTAPSFAVASVKLSASPDAQSLMRIQSLEGRIMIQNQNLRDILVEAYRLKDFQIIGPRWLTTDRYDISAPKPTGLTRLQVRVLLQRLLSERFQLVTHFSSQTMKVYELTSIGAETKLEKAKGTSSSFRMLWGELTGENASLSEFADVLSTFLDRPVVDHTKIAGTYNISLRWMPDEVQAGLLANVLGTSPEEGRSGASSPGSAESPPSLFVALGEQLKLKLRPGRAAIETLVIDSGNRIPSEN